MAILFSGDFHANAHAQIRSVSKKELLLKYKQELFGRIQYHIILGDGGFCKPGNSKTDYASYKSLDLRPFPILCLIGDDDPAARMSDAPEVDIGIGEAVRQIHDAPFIAYLKPGKVYCIDGIKTLVLGGALSTYKDCWPEQERQAVLKLLEADNAFDLILSHTGPCRINKLLFGNDEKYNSFFSDEAAVFNDQIDERARFTEWWCGHWHRDVHHIDEENGQGYQYLYKLTRMLEKQSGTIMLYNEYGADW